MEYITLNNGVKMPMLGYAFIKLHKRNAKDACLMLYLAAIAPLIQHRAISTKNKLEVLFKNQEFQEKIFSLQQRYGLSITGMKKQRNP